MLEIICIIALLIVAAAAPVLLVRGLIRMRRDRRSGVGGGAMSAGVGGMVNEIDRLARPSVEHVIEARESKIILEEDAAGE